MIDVHLFQDMLGELVCWLLMYLITTFICNHIQILQYLLFVLVVSVRLMYEINWTHSVFTTFSDNQKVKNISLTNISRREKAKEIQGRLEKVRGKTDIDNVFMVFSWNSWTLFFANLIEKGYSLGVYKLITVEKKFIIDFEVPQKDRPQKPWKYHCF